MPAEECLATAVAALGAGKWHDARCSFEAALVDEETGDAFFGLAVALWWLGESEASLARCTRAYVLYRAAGDLDNAVRCAVWLGIT
jgi:hypothetical protein